MLKLFYAPNSCAMASHIALEEAGAAYEAVKVDLVAGRIFHRCSCCHFLMLLSSPH